MNMTCGTKTKSLHETKKFPTEITEVRPPPSPLQEPPGRSLAPDAHSSPGKNRLRGCAPSPWWLRLGPESLKGSLEARACH